jgi:PAS domain S-box-containing protein
MNQEESPLLEILNRDQLLETIPSGLFLVDCDQIIVHWNREAERITGYTAQEAVGQHCSFLEGIECGINCGLFDHDAPEKPLIGNSCRIRSKSGKLLYINKNIDLLRHNGQVIGGIESFIDVTEQKSLEDELRRHSEELETTIQNRTAALEEERTQLRSVLDSMTDFAYIVSPDFRITFLNQALHDNVGPIEGELCYKALHHEAKMCRNCPLSEVSTGKIVQEERVFPLSGRTYEVIHTPLTSTTGEPLKLAVCRDITERKEANERLQEANRQLDSFVYTVSHDLRTPLTPIIGFAEFMQNEYRDQLDAQGLDLLSEIEKQGSRMLSLMEDLLQLSRTGHVPAPDKPIDTEAILQNVLTDLASEIAEKKVNISTQPLPRLLLPESLAEELLSNLVRNALHYGCLDGGQIEIQSEETDRRAIIRIIDHGPGISDKEKNRVFDVFFRGAAVKHLPGTGIGLATVQKITRQYNGKVELLDTPDGGCTVVLKFPLTTQTD